MESAEDDKIVLGENACILTTHIQQQGIDQVKNLANHPIFKDDTKIVVQPDGHPGAGCVVGLTMTTKCGPKTTGPKFVVPNLIGVDIGCGVIAAKLGKLKHIYFDKFHKFVVNTIPSGFNNNTSLNDAFLSKVFNALRAEKHVELPATYEAFKQDVNNSIALVGAQPCAMNAICSLCGGNHFLELATDENDDVYFIVHSGSRGLGLKVATYFQNLAVHLLYDEQRSASNTLAPERLAKRKQRPVSKKEHKYGKRELYGAELRALAKGSDKSMAFLTGVEADEYICHMKRMQAFALMNRRAILHQVLDYFGLSYKNCEVIESVHNYINFEDGILRKGAISAHTGQSVIIPLNMAAGSIIGVGKGNPETNYSAPHGAGRMFSRSYAKAHLNVVDFKKQMDSAGIWSECVGKSTLDEAPGAYKDPDYIIDKLGASVEITHRLHPIYNFKSDADNQ